MNRAQRRAAAGRPVVQGINWNTEPPDLCPSATKVILRIRAADDGWIVQHDMCDRCHLYTVVAHPGDQVFACLACGRHGAIGDRPHTADGMRIH